MASISWSGLWHDTRLSSRGFSVKGDMMRVKLGRYPDVLTIWVYMMVLGIDNWIKQENQDFF